MPIIEVSHLTKEYRLGAMQGLKQSLLNTAARLTGKKIEERPLFKALDDVSFSIEQGEVVGITRSPLPHEAVIRPKSLARLVTKLAAHYSAAKTENRLTQLTQFSMIGM